MRSRAGIFSAGVGTLGWAVVVATLWQGQTPHPGAAPLLLFVAVILATRSMAFRISAQSVLSLDSAFYVAAVFSLGTEWAAATVAMSLTLDSLFRWVRTQRRGRAATARTSLLYVLYFGGMSGGLLIVCAHLLAARQLVTAADAADAADVVALRVTAVSVLFLVLHYALQGVRTWLAEPDATRYLRTVAVPGFLAELLVVPIGVLAVLLLRTQQVFEFILLCATYLVLHFVFSRLRRTSLALSQRVSDLEVLGETGRSLASRLELDRLIETISRETSRAIPAATAVLLAHRGAERDTEQLSVERFDVGTGTFSRQIQARDNGWLGAVVARRVDRRDPGLAGSTGGGVRSRLAAPLVVADGVEGVLAVESPAAAAFSSAQLQLLESIALQAGAALQNAHLYQMAMVDGLTGLFMRRYFDARIEEEFERTQRYGSPFSVVMIDVDDFKVLNDTHGHLVGDRVLRAVAAAVQSQMRGVDTAARYGGEELALILPGAEMLAAYALAERIRVAIAAVQIPESPETSLGVTASFGVATHPDSRAGSPEDVVRRADKALYRAKQTGKNRVELYWSDDGESTARQ
jgi:diguanylate cyclase (GGDEF)-like protein